MKVETGDSGGARPSRQAGHSGHSRGAAPELYSIDAAYCDRRSSLVCRWVCMSVCLLVTFVSPAKTAEPIEMPIEPMRC